MLPDPTLPSPAAPQVPAAPAAPAHRADASASTPGEAVSPGQLAHELNNLLDGSLRSVGLVLRELEEAALDATLRDVLDRYLGTADRSMRQMAEVIERYVNAPEASAVPVLPAARLRRLSDKFNPPVPRVGQVFHGGGNFADALRHAVNVYGPALEAQGIALHTRLDPTLAQLPGGATYTLLANAINNARQAIERAPAPGPDGGHRVTVHIDADGDHVVLRVMDTGDGPDPRLFDHRGRFRFGITTRPRGHGVGLSVCRDLAHDLGGRLTLAAGDAQHPGLCFTLRFPRPEAPACAADPAVVDPISSEDDLPAVSDAEARRGR